MRTFRKPKPEKEVQPKRKKHLKTKIALATLLVIITITFGYLLTYLIVEYKETHTWTFQQPLVIERTQDSMTNPMATTSALPVAYAETYKNPFDTRSPKGIAWEMVLNKWGIQEWGYFEELIMRESGWSPYAINQSSGACGLGQALPCSKLGVELWDYEGQLNWIVNYISTRYDTPAKAIEFHNSNNWY